MKFLKCDQKEHNNTIDFSVDFAMDDLKDCSIITMFELLSDRVTYDLTKATCIRHVPYEDGKRINLKFSIDL